MMPLIQIRERGATPRGMKRIFRRASKAAWLDTATHFHREYTLRRFTPEHAAEAKYSARKGQLQPRGSAAFRRSYMGKKMRLYHHQNPLQFSGKSKRSARFATPTSTSKGGRIAYRGMRVFNFRHPRSRVRMNEEFRRIIPREAEELGTYYDRRLDLHLEREDKADGG